MVRIINLTYRVGMKPAKKEGRTSLAQKVGMLIAKNAFEKKITEAVFDRGGYRYQGIVKSVAEGARRGGLRF